MASDCSRVPAGVPDGGGPQQQFAGALWLPGRRPTRDRAGHQAPRPAAAPGGPSARPAARDQRGRGWRGPHGAGGGAGGVPPMDLPVAVR